MKFKKFTAFLTLLLILTFSGCSSSNVALPDGILEVHFIDVGQADCALILSGEFAMLIDGGNVADGDLVVDYIENIGITTIDYLICTHAHEDHVGGLSAVLQNFEVLNVYSPVTEYGSVAFSNFVTYTEAEGLEITIPEVGDTMEIGEAFATVLAPITDYSDANNTSIVLRLDFGETSFLFTGDAEYESEMDMIDAYTRLDADVLKVGHHGSYTSTSYLFLLEVDPVYAVISCGADNDYGHPHEEVMSRLYDADVTVYRTDLQGTIVATSDGVDITFETTYNAEIETNSDEDRDLTVIGNINSKVYHKADCSSLPYEENRVYFETEAEAIDAGYRACSNCIN